MLVNMHSFLFFFPLLSFLIMNHLTMCLSVTISTGIMDCFHKHGKTHPLLTLKLRVHLETMILVCTIGCFPWTFLLGYTTSSTQMNRMSKIINPMIFPIFKTICLFCSWCCWNWWKWSEDRWDSESETTGCFSYDRWRGTWLENSCNFTRWS